jgi:hypothetical protein
MSRACWNPSKRTMGGWPCVELSVPMEEGGQGELTMSGPRGEIWEASADPTRMYKAVVFLRSGDEKIVVFPQSKLAYWRRRLGVSHDPVIQAIYANNFHKDVSHLLPANSAGSDERAENDPLAEERSE